MRRLRATALAATTVLLLAPDASAQSARSPLDPTNWGVVYDVPATRRVTLRADVPYLTLPDRTLKLDLYLPPGLKPGERRPAVVFMNAIGGSPVDPLRRWAIYRSWPRLVAAHGLVGISMDADGDRIQESLRGVFRFLRRQGERYGVDPARLGVYAASANVTGTHTYLTGDSVDPGIRAAALYYGRVPDGHLRHDLPVLFVVAQGDAPRMATTLPGLWQRVVDSALPWTLVFGRGMPHGFDAFTDSDEARRLIQQTLAFWRSHLEPLPPAAPPAEGRTIVAALYGNDPGRSAELLSGWVRRHPEDGEAFMHLGRALADLGRYPEADSAYTRAYQLDSSNPGTLSGLARIRLAEQRWETAEALLLKVVAMGRENSLVQGQLGWARLHLGKNAEAVASYERAIELGIPPGRSTLGVAWYNLACGYVRVGRRDEALAALRRAVEQGVNDRGSFERDPDLAELKGDPRFQQLLDRLGPATAP